MSATNGTAPGPSVNELQEQLGAMRLEAELAQVRANYAQSQLLEGLYTGFTQPGWGGLVDPMDAFRDADAGGTGRPFLIGNRYDRQDGRNRPFVWTDLDLDFIRGQARWIATRNHVAIGALTNLRNFTIRTGYTYDPRPRQGLHKDAAAVALSKQAKEVLDEFAAREAWPDTEKECLTTSRTDGEKLLRAFAQPDGTTQVRTVECEQLRMPLGSPPEWTFGIRNAPGDVTRHVAYAVAYDNLDDWEEVPADQMAHLRLNVPAVVKRGLSDFYCTSEALDGVQKMLRGMLIAGGIQASIPWIEQFDQASAANLQSNVAAKRDQNRPQFQQPVSGQVLNYTKFEPGTIPKIGPGRTYLPAPLAGNTTQHVAIVQACLRAIGARWNMPEYMISGDASNANYASTLVAGSPFVTSVECEQDVYKRFFLRVMTIVLRNAARAGRFVHSARRYSVEELLELVETHATPPRVAIASKAEEWAINKGLVEIGAMSLQTLRTKHELDSDQERANLQEEPLTRVEGRATDLDDKGNPVKGDGRGGQGQAPAPEKVGDGAAGAVAGNDLRSTVGGLQAIASLQGSVYKGELPREAAIANVMLLFGFSQPEAQQLFPEVAPVKTAPEGGSQPPGQPAILGEALRAVIREEFRGQEEQALLEAGNFTGEKKDKRGYRMCYSDGRRVACPKKDAPKKPDKPARKSVDELHAHIEELRKGPIGHEQLQAVAEHLAGLTKVELGELNRRLKAKASAPTKAAMVEKIKARALGGAAPAEVPKPTPKPAAKPAAGPAQPKAAPAPAAPAIPGASHVPTDRPIGERIKGYAKGQALAGHIAQKARALEKERLDLDDAEHRANDELRAFVKRSPNFTQDRGAMRAFGKLDRAYREAQKKNAEARQRPIKDALHEELFRHIDSPVKWEPYVDGNMNDAQSRATDLGAKFAQKMVGAGHFSNAGPAKTSVRTQAIPAHEAQRDYHRAGVGIHLSEGTNSATWVHEFGHWLDDNVPGVGAASTEFLAHRVGSEPLTKLKDRFPGDIFEDSEKGRKDDFEKAFGPRSAYYVGKDYGGRASEILSMGLEKLYTDPAHFARADPEYFAFVVGICDGSLRDYRWFTPAKPAAPSPRPASSEDDIVLDFSPRRK